MERGKKYMTQNINGIDQDNDMEDMRCPRLGVYCASFDSCRDKIISESVGACKAQIHAVSPPLSECQIALADRDTISNHIVGRA